MLEIACRGSLTTGESLNIPNPEFQKFKPENLHNGAYKRLLILVIRPIGLDQLNVVQSMLPISVFGCWLSLECQLQNPEVSSMATKTNALN